MLVVVSVLNIFSSHLMAIINNISVWWHVVGAAAVVLILIFVPDQHQCVQLRLHRAVQQLRLQRRQHHAVSLLVRRASRFGFLLTQYTITGFDACAHLSEETASASMAAAKGIWQSIFYSAIGGWILLLAFLFAIPNVEDGRLTTPAPVRRCGHIFDPVAGQQLGRASCSSSRRRPVLLHDVVHDLALADDLRVQP